MLEYNPSYAKSVGTNEFFFPDTTRHADEIKYSRRRVTHRQNAAGNADDAGLMLDDVNVNYNKGFAARKALLGLSAEVNCEIPLNRDSFFEALQDKLLPNTKIDLNIEFDDDKNLIWRQGAADVAGTSYRLIIRRLQLFVPRLVFNSEGQKLYMEDYLKPYKWTYLKETVFTSNLSTQNSGHFRITNGISKPRHVFVFFITNANINNQLQNSFLYNTFSISTNPRTLNRCYLEVGNGNEYPRIHYKPAEDASRVFRDVMSYVNANNYLQGGTLLNISNFKTLYPFVYFDLTKQKMDIKDRITKLSFHYELSGATATDYIIYGVVLHEQEERLNTKFNNYIKFNIIIKINKTTSYIEHSVNLTDNQKMNLAKSIKNKCPLTLRIKYSDLAGDDEMMFTVRQIKKIKKAMENGTGVDIKISKTQIRKIAKEGGNLFSSLASLGARVLPYAVKGLSKAVPALATA